MRCLLLTDVNFIFILGKNSDILIHEATMDDSLHKSAKLKLHSTSSQAINIGKEMNARFIILTHFSQRYSHVPIFNDNFTKEIGVAFDNMMVMLIGHSANNFLAFYQVLKLKFFYCYRFP